MRNSVTVWLTHDEVPTIDFQEDCNDMIALYLGSHLEIYIHRNELKYLAERIDKFLKDK